MISAPYYPEDEGARIVTDVFVLERHLLDEDDQPVDMSAWVIGLQITNSGSEVTNITIPNNSPFFSRPANNKIRLKAPTPVALGMNLPIVADINTVPDTYEMRFYRITEDGQETFWYVDMKIYRRLPKSVNVSGPLMAEVFVHKLTNEGGITISTDIAASLETRIYDLEAALANVGSGTVISLAAAQALATGPNPKEWWDTVNRRKYGYPGNGNVLELLTTPA